MDVPSGETTSTVITVPAATGTVVLEDCGTAVPFTFIEVKFEDRGVGLMPMPCLALGTH